MRSGVIYLYTFPNGKVYVGQTRRDPQVRHREHLDPKIGPQNGAFWKAYQEQGEPKYEILETHEFAEFCLQDDIRTYAHEYVHENAAQLLDEYIDKETIYQLNMDGEIVAKFDSQQNAAEAMGVKNAANINNAVLGKQKTAYGYRWVKAINYQPTK